MTRALEQATRALRERFSGEAEDTDLQWLRIERSVGGARSKRMRVAGVPALAALVVGSSVWAATSNSLWETETAPAQTPAPSLAGAPPRGAPGTASASAPASITMPPGTASASAPASITMPPGTASASGPTPDPGTAASPVSASPSVPSLAEAPRDTEAVTASASAPAPVAKPTQEPADAALALYARAHRLHFDDKDPAAALHAWESYLEQAPTGGFSLEARYNRAVTLVRLGRHEQARVALRPFAEAPPGSYRQAQALRLLRSLDRSTVR